MLEKWGRSFIDIGGYCMGFWIGEQICNRPINLFAASLIAFTIGIVMVSYHFFVKECAK